MPVYWPKILEEGAWFKHPRWDKEPQPMPSWLDADDPDDVRNWRLLHSLQLWEKARRKYLDDLAKK